jgi:hypothetical protein
MEVLAGPQQTPPRVSLISSAEIVPVEGRKWEGGFIADLDGHGNVAITPICDADDLTITRTGGVASFKPYTLYATNKSSTFGDDISIAEFYDKAQRKLLAGESAALEAILWNGYAGAPNENPFLADGAGEYASDSGISALDGECEPLFETATISSTATTVQNALARLEQEMGEASSNRGMVHIRPIAFHALVADAVVRREGNVWLTPMDNIIVPGRGYAGTGPTGQAVGATEWMYGHPGIVQIRRSEIIRLGEDDLSSQIHRGWNDHEAVVMRVAHVLLDPTAPIFAIDFNSIDG